MSGTLVLSPNPLAPATRKQLADGARSPVEFVDLATLRRQGIPAAIRRLRSAPRSGVVAAAEAGDQLFLGDPLALAALLVPADDRLLMDESGRLVPLYKTRLPAVVLRMMGGIAAGAFALVANHRAATRILRTEPRKVTARGELRRCLYLKPSLQFGIQVGGSVAHVSGVVNAMAAGGIDVEMLVNARHPMIGNLVTQRAFPPRFLPAYPYELNAHRYHGQFLAEARRRAVAAAPDFIYQRYILNDLTGARLREALGIPLLLEFNGSETWVQRNWGRPLRFEGASRAIELANLHAADAIVVVSAEVARQAEEMGIRRDKIIVYPNCVDASVFDPSRFDTESRRRIRDELGVPAQATLFTFVGTFGRWHGAETLAAAIALAAERGEAWLGETRAHFLFVGDGLMAPRVREILAGEASARVVTHAGLRPQEETPGILAASDVLVSPHVPNADGSPFFGSPTKLFEYMAMAKLIVASDLDQLGQVLRGWRPGEAPRSTDGPSEAGMLVPPGDAPALAVALRRAAEMSEEERGRYGGKARELVAAAFSWEANVRTVLGALERAISSEGIFPSPPSG